MSSPTNSSSATVSSCLTGYALCHPSVSLLDALPAIKVLLHNLSSIDCSAVCLISGGGAGHAPAHEGYIGTGMLTGCVVGEVFASPPTSAVLSALETVYKVQHSNSASGCVPSGSLLIIKNYTGDRLNFGLACEQVRLSLGYACEMLVVGDDVTIERNKGITGRRGIAGTVFVHKIVGAAAQNGMKLKELLSFGNSVASRIVSIGMATESCRLPSSRKAERIIPEGEYELGLGIHGEPGLQKVQLENHTDIVKRMLDVLLSTDSQRDYFWKEAAQGDSNELSPSNLIRVALLVNNLGAITDIELNSVALMTYQQLQARGIQVVRLFCGTYMTALDMKGFSISLLRMPSNEEKYAEIISLIDQHTSAPAWKSNGLISNTTTIAYQPLSSSSLSTSSSRSSVPLLRTVLKSAAERALSSESELNHLDSVVGDGDCGSTLATAARSILADIDSIPCDSVRSLFSRLTHYSSLMGGSSGAIYQIFFTAAAAALNSSNEIIPSSHSLAAALGAGASAVSKYGMAKAGDRTLLDALLPAITVIEQSHTKDTAAVIAANAALAAEKGSDLTRGMCARAGRSNYVSNDKLQTVSDPGAKSVSIIFQAIAQALSSAQ